MKIKYNATKQNRVGDKFQWS